MPAAARKRSATETRTTTISLRMSDKTREMIDTAAAALGKTRTEFMLESARQHAVDVLLDQRIFMLSPKDFDAFVEVLDNPPPPSSQLKALFKRKPSWET